MDMIEISVKILNTLMKKYKRGKSPIEKSTRIAGVSISKMLDIMEEHRVTANIEEEDYLKSLETIRKIW